MAELKCGHTEEYRCEFCSHCCQCTHIYQWREDGWWSKCTRIFRSHKCIGPVSIVIS